MTEKRQPCASDSGVLPEPWPGTEQGVRQDRKKKNNGKNRPKTRSHADDAICKVIGWGHRLPPAGLPIEQVLGEYSLFCLNRDVALFDSIRAPDSF